MSIISAVQQFKDALQDANTKLIASEEAVVYYREQKAKLEETIAAIEAILPASSLDVAPPAARRDTRPAAKSSGKTVEIPATSSEFFMGCLSKEEQKTDAILAVAAEKLGVSGDEKLAVLRQRMTVFLQKGAKEEKFQSKGERQNRVYFL